VTNVADEIATAEVAPDRIVVANPGFVYEGRPWQARQTPMLMPPWGLEAEREIHYGRLEAAKMFAAANRLNRITIPTPDAWLGIAAPGKTYYDLREALAELGLDNAALRQYGIRLLKIEMLFRWSRAPSASSPAASRRFWSSRRSARSASSSSATSSTTRPSARGWSANPTRRAGRSCPPTASSMPTGSPRSSPRASSGAFNSSRSRRAWRSWRRCASGPRP